MRCISCKEELAAHDARTCKECSDEAIQTLVELKREIQKLKAMLAFLSSSSPIGHHHPLGGRSGGLGFTDVVLVAAEDGPNGGPSMPVPAHSAILASGSPVFKAMFENEMEESRSGTVKISDISYDGLRAFVDYLYAGACLDEQMACELLILAGKYQWEHLKAYCEEFLVSKLNWDNSMKYYAFAHQEKAKVLLEGALSFLWDNIDKIEEHQEYSEYFKKDLRLVLNIYIAFHAKRKKSVVEFSIFLSDLMGF